MRHPVDMRDQTKDLRDLGAKLEEVARRHRCYSQASQYVVVLRDFLTAVGAVTELNQELAKRDDIISAQSAEIARLREALDAAYDGLNDWTATYAKEFCSDEMVATAQRRISVGGGTLAYIAGIVEKIRRARAALETKG